MDSEGPDQTLQADLGFYCQHMPQDTFSHGTAHIVLIFVISASRFPTPSSTLTDLVTITGDKQHLAALVNLFEDHISQDWFEPWDSLNWVVNNL